MKTAAWGAFMVSVAALAAGCGGDGSSNTGSGGAGGGETMTTTVSTNSSTGSTTPTAGSTTVSTSTASGMTTTSSGMMACGTYVFPLGAQCQTCMTEQCCAEIADCDKDCSDLIDCIGSCADQACANKCFMDHPAGQSTAAPVLQCFQNSCSKDPRCSGEPAFPICDSHIGSNNPKQEACTKCLGSNCCAEFEACSSDADKSCLTCFNNPSGPGCATDTEANAAITCLTSKCSMECK